MKTHDEYLILDLLKQVNGNKTELSVKNFETQVHSV